MLKYIYSMNIFLNTKKNYFNIQNNNFFLNAKILFFYIQTKLPFNNKIY